MNPPTMAHRTSTFMLTTALSFAAATLAAQPENAAPAPELSAQSRLTSAALQSDLALLRRAYTQLHPGLYRSNTPQQVESTFDRLGSVWAQDRSLRDAYLDLSAALASFRCGHSYANFFNQPKPIASTLFLNSPRVPFSFRWIDRQIVVTRSFAETPELTPGTTITAINGIPAATILDTLTKFARADGANNDKRTSLLEVRADESLETFDVFFALCFPLDSQSPGSYSLDCHTPAGKSQLITVPALTPGEREARAKKPTSPPPSGTPEFSFELDEWSARRLPDRSVLLRMDHWVVYKTTWDWMSALNSFMDTIAKDGTPNLILDIRANEGGNDCGDVILARLIDKPIALPSSLRHVRYRSVPAELNPILDTWDDSFRDWKSTVTLSATPPALLVAPPLSHTQFFRLRRDADDDPAATLSPAPGPKFSGKLWVLISSTNSSATFQFAAAVKATKLGTLVGTTTGGNQRGINGGCFFFIRLPSTGFEVDLPLIAYTPCSTDGKDLASVPDAGIDPDIRIKTTALDIANGIDPELFAVQNAIRLLAPPK